VGSKGLQQRILSLDRRIAEHEEKIFAERTRGNPDDKLIAHWEKEIKAFRKGIDRARKRLGGTG
jgi:hypothetical protein